uniref:Uncharacterized protein n=1 Tax=Hordeum vulgare subsp. vulgare TaxID=112509 RepID=A0A8I6XVL8_HORVV
MYPALDRRQVRSNVEIYFLRPYDILAVKKKKKHESAYCRVLKWRTMPTHVVLFQTALCEMNILPISFCCLSNYFLWHF